ncbi:hypothetical protein MtrunA17_Chr3g0129461 [Medicago truncatula]|uniref:Uncharacterized protein n=1 Tax=Medicago truncatula TaxID=3880 RepID=A0A396IYZ0_MEDTR|nr:hypothetical protein MtrunA17_Chr3g0129461 [Medicago truncatula]
MAMCHYNPDRRRFAVKKIMSCHSRIMERQSRTEDHPEVSERDLSVMGCCCRNQTADLSQPVPFKKYCDAAWAPDPR